MKLPTPVGGKWTPEYQALLNASIEAELRRVRRLGDIELQRDTLQGVTRDETIYLFGPDSVRYDLRTYLRLRAKAESGTTYTFAIGDENYLVRFTHSSGCTATVPPNSDVAFPTNTVIHPCQWGAAQVTIAAGSGVTIRSSQTLKSRAQYAPMTLLKIDTNEWLLFGEREA